MSSPNGSKIIVYGYEQGIRFVWRGGKPLKSEPQSSDTRPNGIGNEVIDLDSSDDDHNQIEAYEDHPVYEDEEEEYDPAEPYESTIQTLELPLGVEVLHLAFPHLPADIHRASIPALLSQKIIVAAACSDCSIRLITLPLTPPSPQSKARPQLRNATATLGVGKTLYGEQMIVLSSGVTHQSVPKGVSISITAASSDDPEDEDMDMDRGTSSRHTSRSRSRSRLGTDQTWDLLVASHSTDLSGLLLIHRIPLVAEGTSLSTELHIPWRTQHLASRAVTVDFSTAIYPSMRHSQILIAEEKGAVRILDCLPQSNAMQASWLVSMYTGFETTQNVVPRRIPILSARWVLGGKAILVLQADGKWGIWNHEGAGPKPTNAVNASSRIIDGLLTGFAIEGWVGDILKSKPLLKNSSGKNEGRSKLAPMTPSTRKIKQDALFTGPTVQSDGPIRGGLDVVPASDVSDSRPDDESVLLWHGSNIVVIPSFYTHWQNKIRGSGNLFGSGAKGEPKVINNIQLGGESCTKVSLLSIQNQKQANILVTGEKRLLIVTPPLKEPETSASLAPPMRATQVDQQMLEQGELDIDGMDRIMSGMANGHTSRRNSQLSSRSRKSSQGLLLS